MTPRNVDYVASVTNDPDGNEAHELGRDIGELLAERVSFASHDEAEQFAVLLCNSGTFLSGIIAELDEARRLAADLEDIE